MTLSLKVEGLRFRYDPEQPYVLDGIDFSLHEGEHIVVAGRNGSGKSTLARLIAGLYEPQQGRILWSSKHIRVGYVLQHPETQMIAGTVEEEIAFGLENQGLPTELIRAGVDHALRKAGLEALRYRNPARLSGGEMQRVALASVDALDPDLWLLDEPTAYIDPLQREIWERTFRESASRKSVVRIVSDPDDLPPGDRVLLLHEGRLIAEGTLDELYRSGALEQAGMRPPRPVRLRNGQTASTGHVAQPRQQENDNSSEALDKHEPESSHYPARPALEVERLRADRKLLFGPVLRVLDGITFHAGPGERIALVGPSGSGKSTLLEVLAGLLEPVSGRVRWEDKLPSALHGRLAVTFQFPERGFFASTVLEEVMFGPLNLGVARDEARDRAMQALRDAGLGPDRFASRNPFELSMGQARRAAFAVQLALQPVAWLMDEPTAGLDEEGAERVAQLIAQESASGCVILVAGHDSDFLTATCERWIRLENGTAAYDGPALKQWRDGPPDPWPPPAVVRVWREEGRPPEQWT
ncbi:ATP-binding cassette domain-containing protein [bacterium]|nr:ATP-binding cassette domain-containing protein [bacterium]